MLQTEEQRGCPLMNRICFEQTLCSCCRNCKSVPRQISLFPFIEYYRRVGLQTLRPVPQLVVASSPSDQLCMHNAQFICCPSGVLIERVVVYPGVETAFLCQALSELLRQQAKAQTAPRGGYRSGYHPTGV